MGRHEGAANDGRRRLRRRCLHSLCITLLVLGLFASPHASRAEGGGDAVQTAQTAQTADVPCTRQGADACLKCHDSPRIMSVFQTPHADKADARTPFAKLQCESCHGPGGEHGRRLRRGEARPPILGFGSDTPFPVADQNAKCLGCHEKDMAAAWHSGVHDQQGVACADCHTVHAAHDPVLSDNSQPEVCYTCHQRTRSQFQRAFTHPVRFDQMTCSDCHAPHESLMPNLLKGATLNQTCYTCHAEKRGPFLWEHPPATEDCALCHRPHGSNHRWLLTKGRPLLCQDCHSRAGHPSVAYGGDALAGGANPSQFVLGGSCTNCHTRVHGSNHPSGAQLLR